MLAWLRAERPEAREQIDGRASAIIAAEPETMSLFLARVRDRHGSFAGYADFLGVASAVVHLQHALLDE